MCSARQLMVFNVCVKFHVNMSRGFKVMERTQKIANTHAYAGGIIKSVFSIFSVPTHFFICGVLYPLSIKSAGMKLIFEGTR